MTNFGFEDVMSGMRQFHDAMHEARVHPPWQTANREAQQRWNPYSFEGGSTAAIAGENFAVAASDTRLTAMDICVISRDTDKIHILNNNIILNTCGFHGDVLAMRRLLEARLHKYRFDYRCDMTVDLCAEMLARNLYYRRFFPYYTGAILAGVDEEGKGAVFSYDPIGCIERLTYSSSGAAEPLIQPFLDNQVGHVSVDKSIERPPLTLDRALGILRDAFKLSSEREITTGDRILCVIAEKGKPTRKEYVSLRED
ncbi:CRE-PBS-6 protein [Aphelenchoides avenae]|nr:CRE-PBS-6 protein [Aphelenchus avenae]